MAPRSVHLDAKVRRLLIEARKRAGKTQAEVADGLGRVQSYIAQIESGAIGLYFLDFLALSEILGFDPCQFLNELQTAANGRESTRE